MEQALLTDEVINQAAILLIAHENNPESQKIILQLQAIVISNLIHNNIYKGVLMPLDDSAPYAIAILKKQKDYLDLISRITDEKKLNAAKHSFLLKRTLFDALFDIHMLMDIGKALRIAEQSDRNTIKRTPFNDLFDINRPVDTEELMRIIEQLVYNTNT